MTVEQRLLDKCVPEPNSGCWLWTASSTKHPTHPYGMIGFKGKVRIAHRVAYECWVGPIPQGMHVCHKCDVTLCINPDHLFAGTRLDNMRDASIKGRAARKQQKLSPEMVRRIRSEKRPLKEWGQITGASIQAINHVQKGRTWKYVQ